MDRQTEGGGRAKGNRQWHHGGCRVQNPRCKAFKYRLQVCTFLFFAKRETEESQFRLNSGRCSTERGEERGTRGQSQPQPGHSAQPRQPACAHTHWEPRPVPPTSPFAPAPCLPQEPRLRQKWSERKTTETKLQTFSTNRTILSVPTETDTVLLESQSVGCRSAAGQGDLPPTPAQPASPTGACLDTRATAEGLQWLPGPVLTESGLAKGHGRRPSPQKRPLSVATHSGRLLSDPLASVMSWVFPALSVWNHFFEIS